MPEVDLDIKVSPRIIKSTLVKQNNDEDRIYKIGARDQMSNKKSPDQINTLSPRQEIFKEDATIDIFGNKRSSVQPVNLEKIFAFNEPKKPLA